MRATPTPKRHTLWTTFKVSRTCTAYTCMHTRRPTQDNEYIQRYYRRTLPVADSIKSLFGLHNETGNIYTHLLGFFLFLFMTVYIVYEEPTPLAFGHRQVGERTKRGNVRGVGMSEVWERTRCGNIRGAHAAGVWAPPGVGTCRGPMIPHISRRRTSRTLSLTPHCPPRQAGQCSPHPAAPHPTPHHRAARTRSTRSGAMSLKTWSS